MSGCHGVMDAKGVQLTDLKLGGVWFGFANKYCARLSRCATCGVAAGRGADGKELNE